MFGAAAQSSGSVFGAPNQGSTSVFGAPAQSSGSLFGAPAQSSASLFGAPAQNTVSAFGAPAASSASLFGASAASSASLFGAPAASSASLFGAPAASSASLFGAPAASSASLFGAPAASSASLFGAPAASSASLFGAPAQSSTPSLFGAPQSTGSLFGAQPQSTPSLFGAQQNFAQQPQSASLWNNASNQYAGQQPNVQAQPVQITGQTRISELPQNYQTDLFAVERHLREQRTKSSRLSSKRDILDSQIDQLKSRSSNVTRRLVKLRADIEALQANSNTLKAAVRTERGSAEPAMIALDNLAKSLSNSSNFHDNFQSHLYTSANDNAQGLTTHVPEEYFIRIIGELETRAHEYKGEIDEIAEFLRAQGVLLSSTSSSFGMARSKERVHGKAPVSLLDNISQRYMDIGLSPPDPSAESRGKTIEDIIRRQYEYFMVVASHVAGVHENLRSVRDHYLRLLRARDPDTLNPFEQADSRERAEKDRQRILAEKRASEDAMGFGTSSTALPSQQGDGIGNPSGGFAAPLASSGQSQGLFGASSSGMLGGGGLGSSTPSGGLGGGGLFGDTNSSGLMAPSSRRSSGSRRKR